MRAFHRYCVTSVTFIFSLTVSVAVSHGNQAQVIDAFRFKDQAELQRTWQGTFPASVGTRNFGAVGNGVVFPCKFPKAGDRCYWDRSLEKPLDLSSSKYFRISMHLDDGMNVKERSIGFGIADQKDPSRIQGWYIYWLPDSPAGMSSFLMEKSEFRTEGEIPEDGWSRIKQIRLSFFGGMSESAANATVVELTASEVPTKTDVELIESPAMPKLLENLEVIPAPQKWERTKADFHVSSRRLRARSTDDEATQRVIKLMARDFGDTKGVELLSEKFLTAPEGKRLVWISNQETVPAEKVKELTGGGKIPAEGYRLDVSPAGILMVADDEKGLFYAFQTLNQLLKIRGDELSVPGGTIIDSPTLQLRAIYLHWITGEKGMEKARKFIRALAALKYNTLFIDVGARMKYDSRPFPATGKDAFTKQQMRELAEYAREYHIDICPFYQMFGHTPWIGAEPGYRHLMENPEKVNWYSSWCASNPETFEFATDILGEAIEVFQPPYVHISHDEIDFTDAGTCPKCKGQAREDLIAKSMNTLSDFLTSKGVKTIVSGDTFIPWMPRNSAENQLDGDRILRQIRKTIIINHWAYGGDYAMHDRLMKPVEKFGFTGLLQTFSPWWHDWDIRISAQIIRDRKGLGVIGTTWHDWGSFDNYPDLVADHSLGLIGLTANYSWNPDSPEVGYAQIDWNQRIRPLIDAEAGVSDNLAFRSVSLKNMVNAGNQSPANRAGLPKDVHLDSSGCVPGISYQTEPNAGCVMLRGHATETTLPETVTIPVEAQAEALYFFHALSEPYDLKLWQTPERIQIKPKVGQYAIFYEDESSVILPLHFRLNVTTWNSPYGYNKGSVAWQGKDQNNRLVRIGCTPWRNPSPEKKISRIEFSTAMESGMNPMLFAITATERKSK